ncbi:hypothetical protein [Undibacterium sp. Tian12W]|uniref:hypothetical protein n=1 Tax=Undibacterium sp. Tian12W TaxID=3413054 RepID=UPI003BF05BE2
MSEQQPDSDDVINLASESVPGIQGNAKGLEDSAPVVLMFILAHLVLTGINLPYYFELLRTGVVAMTTVVLTLLGWIFLYLGGIQNARKSKSSGTLWMSATVFLALSLPGWRMIYIPGGLVLFGCLMALAGWWSVRQSKKSD